ncbi:hypothetical protein Bca52824_022913 [Brassica carinata]|uniref:Agenet domain-containing protein n=1 Tax=Brassica carinata TaxID=52824 RepID=A0A8X7VHH9_BRACI|nr:hypothetical protein Bca52824_022913 [Brassica carinata]
MKNLKKKEKSLPVSKGCEVEVSPRDERFQGSWFRAILEQAPAKVKGEKLRFRYKTLINEGGANPCREYIERCFIRPVPPECLNQGVKFKEGSVVDAYYSYGWWHGVIVVEEEDGNFLVYFDDPPDILKFDKNQMRPHAHWTGFKWVTRKNKELSKGMFSTGKLVEVTRKIDEREDIWVQSFVLKEIQGGDKREFFVKRCTSSQHLNDDAEEITTTVDIFNMRPSPPRDLFAKYELQDIVEVFVGYGWCKGEVKEILLDDQYKVSFKDTEERTIFKNHNIRRLMKWEDGVSIHAHMTEFEKEADTNVATPAITPQVVVKCILGDPELHSNLVEEVNTQFASVVDLVQRRYHVKRGDWRNGKIKIPIAEAEVEKNNYGPGIDATDKDKIEFLTKKIATLKERVEYLENLLKILQSYMTAQKQQNTKVIRSSLKMNTNKWKMMLKSTTVIKIGKLQKAMKGGLMMEKNNERKVMLKSIRPFKFKGRNEKEEKKGADANTSKSRKQKIQAAKVSVDDIIGNVLEDLNLKSQTHKEKEQQEESDAEVEKPVEGEKKKQGRERGTSILTHVEGEPKF